MTPDSAAEPAGSRRLRPPAKINLGLRLMGLRDDGYHLLESVFAPIDLCDEVEVEWTPGPAQIELSMAEDSGRGLPKALAGVSAGPGNLVYRAAEAFQAASGLGGRIRLELRKAIPAGAGLGGGSSDAAAVLLALSSLAGSRSPGSKDLAELALGLGADVPYFLAPQMALVRGIGELIEPIEGLPSLHLVIANPGISVATAEVYRAADALGDSLTEPRPGSTMRAILRLRSETEAWGPALGDLLINDLEQAAIRLCPPIGRLLGRMQELGSLGVSMSGSGATVFGVFESAEQAAKAARELDRNSGEAFREKSAESAAGQTWVRVTRTL